MRAWRAVSTPPAARGDRRQRLGRQGVVAGDARHLLDQVGLALDVAPPGRRLRPARPRCSKPRSARIVRIRVVRQLEAGQPLRHRPDRRRSAGGGAGDLAGQPRPPRPRRRRAPGSAAVASSRPGTTKPGSTPRAKRYWASETMPVVAAGLGGADRIEPGALDEHLGGGLRAAGGLAAHDPAEADGARAVGDDAHLGRRPRRSCRPAPRPSRPRGRAAPR